MLLYFKVNQAQPGVKKLRAALDLHEINKYLKNIELFSN